MQIHKQEAKYSSDTTIYYFTKNKNECLSIEHDRKWDFGEHSTSGTEMKVEIHYNNSWVKNNLEKITLADVPKRVKDVLSYLSVGADSFP